MHSGAQTHLAAAMDFQGFPKGTEQNSVVGVDGPIVRQYLDGLKIVSLLIEVRREVDL